jgi:hypothetical protein
MRAGGAVARSRRASRRGIGCRLACLPLWALFVTACASCAARSFAPASAERAASAVEAWGNAVARAGAPRDANLLYDAAISQGMMRTGGTLAVRLRGERVEGTLAGPFGSPVATYSDGELRGEKLAPVRLPPPELRAVLAGIWIGGAPEIAGENGSEVLLRWTGEDAAEGIFDVGRGELTLLRVERPDGRLEARFSGSRNPWPDRIEIEEKRTGSRLRLKLLSREIAP